MPTAETVTSDGTVGLLDWLEGITDGPLHYLSADTTPSPSHRPRVTKRGFTYYAKPYQQYLTDCTQQFASINPAHGEYPLTGRLAAVIVVTVEKPRTSKLRDPNGDTDNYAKGPLDALQKAGVIQDDKQIIHLGITRAFVVTAGEKPGVLVALGKLKE